MRVAILVCLGLASIAAAAHAPALSQSIAALRIGAGPFLPGGRIVPQMNAGPVRLALVGPGSISQGAYLVPYESADTSATLIASADHAIAIADVRIAPAPNARRALLAVAAYDEGLVLHDPHGFSRIGTVATGGNPSDVAFTPGGDVATTDTSGNRLTIVHRSPWHVDAIPDVPVGNEIAVDASTASIFVSNRDIAGYGALTRVPSFGQPSRLVTGVTAEALVVDQRRSIIYVGNVNDGTVLAVDMRALRPLRRIPAVPRVFGLALSRDGNTLFAVANQSAASRFQAAGFVGAIDLRTSRVVARSRALRFPLGVAYDPRRDRLFITDEESNVVYVLDARTLHDIRAPLATCDTPWKPYYDAPSQRVFIPCARSNRIDVYDTRSLRRVRGAPFATGGYPLAVSIWRPSPN